MTTCMECGLVVHPGWEPARCRWCQFDSGWRTRWEREVRVSGFSGGYPAACRDLLTHAMDVMALTAKAMSVCGVAIVTHAIRCPECRAEAFGGPQCLTALAMARQLRARS